MIKGDVIICQHELSPQEVFRWIKSDLSLTFKQAGDGAMVLIINIKKLISQALLVGVLPQCSRQWRTENITPKLRQLCLLVAKACRGSQENKI